MATIDEKIVKLTVNNQGFESKLSASASALQKLNQILGRGIGGGAVAADAKQISTGVSDASAALENMSGKTSRLAGAFDTLKIAAGVALGNIATKAVEVGAGLVKSLTIQPILDGLAEYNLQMSSVQTILANTKSKGETIQTVTAALDELNRYADMTIYNFAAMTQNIGKFTAAGVGLDDSTAAVKGIANMAALAGANSEEASRAMYQLSQALSAGTIKLMDWRSVENASMGGEQLREALMTTARVHGVAVDDMIAKQGSFRDSLQEGWLTSEIFLETMKIMTGDLSEAQIRQMGYSEEQAKMMYELGQTALHAATEFKTWSDVQTAAMESVGSGWAKTFQILFGDYEESKALWTEVGNAITGVLDRIGDSRNNFLQGWKDLGGRTSLINGLRNAINALAKPLQAIGKAFGEVFDGISPKNLADATGAFERFTQKLIISDSTASKITRVFKGLFSVLQFGWTIFSQLAKVVLAVVGVFAKLTTTIVGLLGTGLLNIGSAMGDIVSSFQAWFNSLDLVGKALEFVTPYLKTFGDWLTQSSAKVRDFGSELASKVPGALDTVKAKLSSAASSAKEFLLSVKESFANSAFASALRSLKAAAVDLAGGFKTLASTFSKETVDGVKEYGNGFVGAAKSLFNAAKTSIQASGLYQTAKEKLASVADWLQTEFPQKITAGVEKVADILSNLSTYIQKIKDAVKSGFDGIDFDMGGRRGFAALLTGLVGGSLWVGIKKLKDAFGGVSKIGKSFKEAMEALTGCLKSLQTQIKAKTLLAIAAAVALLAASMVALSFVDPKKLAVSVTAMSVAMAGLIAAMKSLSKLNGGVDMMASAASLVLLSIAMGSMAKAIAKLGALDTGQVVQGTIVVSLLAAELVAMAKALASDEKKMLAGVAGVATMAHAVVILSAAIALLGHMDLGTLAKGVGTVSALVLVLASAANGMGNIKSAKGAGVVLAMVAALQGMAITVAALSRMSWGDFASGLVKMAATLGILVGATRLLDGVNGMTGAGSMLAMVLALQGLAIVIAGFATMPWDSYLKGVVSMGLVLTALVVAAKQLDGVKGMSGAGSLVMLSASLIGIAAAIKVLGSMNPKAAAVGLGAFAAALGVLVVTARATSKIGPGFLIFAGGVALLGAACALAGAGLLAFSVGLASVAASGTAAFAVLAAGIASMLYLLPLAGRELGKAFVEFVKVLNENRGTLKSFFTNFMSDLLDGFNTIIPKIGTTAVLFLKELARVITEAGPALIESVVVLIESLLVSIAEHAPAMVQAGWDILLAFVQGIRDNVYEVTTVAGEAVVAFIDGLAVNAEEIASSGMTLLSNWLNGVAEGMPDVVDSASDVIVNFLQGLADNIGDIVTAGSNLIVNFLNGVAANIGDIVTAGVNVIVNFLNGVAANIPRIAEAGVNVIIAFINAIAAQSVRIVNASMEAVLTFVRGLTDAIHRYSPQFRQAGKDLLWEIINGLTGDIPRKSAQVFNDMKQIGGNIVSGIKAGFSSAWNNVSSWIGSKVSSLKNSVKNALGIHSPSRVMAEIFRWVPLGMVKGMEQTETALFRKVDNLATSPVDILNEAFAAVDTELDLNPVLTPVLDLSQVTAGARDIRNLLDGSGTTYTMAADISRTTSGEAPRAGIQEIHNHYDIDFEQNITAPKSLDAVDIARSTRGVLSEYERAMKGY